MDKISVESPCQHKGPILFYTTCDTLIYVYVSIFILCAYMYIKIFRCLCLFTYICVCDIAYILYMYPTRNLHMRRLPVPRLARLAAEHASSWRGWRRWRWRRRCGLGNSLVCMGFQASKRLPTGSSYSISMDMRPRKPYVVWPLGPISMKVLCLDSLG